MKLFTQLFTQIDQTTKTNAKIAALVAYFEKAAEEDLLPAVSVLIGNRPRRPVRTADLKAWAAEMAGIPLWLFEESYYVTGDLAETISLVLPAAENSNSFDLRETLQQLRRLHSEPETVKKQVIFRYWSSMDKDQRFVFNKLITGNFRMGLSRQLVIKALARYLGYEETAIAHRLMGKWDAEQETLQSLFAPAAGAVKHYLPYPFFLSYPLEEPPGSLGPISDWIIEKKLDGIRGQIIVRDQTLFVWSRGEELLTEKFPEFALLQELLPAGTVIDGEIIPWRDGMPLPFSVMQTRIGRKTLSAKMLKEAPLVMVTYDLLEWQGNDIRQEPLYQRRQLLVNLLNTTKTGAVLLLSEALDFSDWAEAADFRKRARLFYGEGLMLKKKNSVYETGRRKGNWWKWKTDPMSIDGVLLYGQSGHGRRANLFTDYTFAVWDEQGSLVPFAKAYSGLTDQEIISLDQWIRRNTLEKFGPVRSVRPELVFEIGFEGINPSPRHKSGVALRFPRILRWRHDKTAAEANTRKDLLQLMISLQQEGKH